LTGLRLSSVAAFVAAVSPAVAACPMSLAVYAEAGGASVEFRPGESMVATNTFHMLLRNDVALDGFVLWSDEPARPYGSLQHNCPEGDVTGEEIAACTAWQGAVYAVEADGKITTLPGESESAPAHLIFADLAAGLLHSSVYGAVGVAGLPWDAFTLSGCQE
jgi:hypothetical protein